MGGDRCWPDLCTGLGMRATPADPWLVACFAALLGSAGPSAPEAVTATAVSAMLFTWRVVSWRSLALALACLLVCWQRAAASVEDFEQRRTLVRDQLGAPSVCAGQGRVTTSPVRMQDTVRTTVEFARLECDGRVIRLPTPLRALLYGGPAELTRGTELSVLAKLGALSMFRNAAANDPTPAGARRDVLLTGAALSVDITTPGAGLFSWIDNTR